MALKAIIEKLEDAPEALREHYRAGTKDEGAEGKFVLGVEAVGGWNLEDVTGLKTALGRERTAAQNATAALNKFVDKEGKTLDANKVVAALDELEQLKTIDPKNEADKLANAKFESLKTQLLQSHGQEIAAKDERLNLLNGTISGLLVDAVATAALAEAKGSVDLLLPHVRTQAKVVEKDGKFTVEVIGKDGNARVNSKAEPMSIDELVAEMRASDTFSRAFEGDGQSGSGKEEDTGKGGKGGGKGDIGGTRSERAAHFAQKFNLPTE